MATTRIISMHVNQGKTIADCLTDRIDYSKNPDKTQGGELISAYQCDPKTADDEGLDALMKKYGDPLTLYIDGYLHDVHEAEELMLDVFAYLFTKKPKIRDGGFKAYLYKAARHMALRHRSRRKLLFSLDALPGGNNQILLLESRFLAALKFF